MTDLSKNIQALREKKAVVEMGGGEAAIEKQIAMGKLTAVIVFYPCWTRILSMNMTCS